MFEMSLYHNLWIISWHKHTARTSQMDTVTQTEFCHWERQQTNLSLKKTNPWTPLVWAYHITASILRALLAHCLDYSSSAAAVQRKLQPWDFIWLHLRVNVTKWHFSFLPLMYDEIKQIWQKWRPGETLKKRKLKNLKNLCNKTLFLSERELIFTWV